MFQEAYKKAYDSKVPSRDLLQILEETRQYFSQYPNHSWIEFSIDTSVMRNAEYKDGRTLTLNSSAGQVVEATNKAITVGAGYKIVGFNTVLKMKKSTQFV